MWGTVPWACRRGKEQGHTGQWQGQQGGCHQGQWQGLQGGLSSGAVAGPAGGTRSGVIKDQQQVQQVGQGAGS